MNFQPKIISKNMHYKFLLAYRWVSYVAKIGRNENFDERYIWEFSFRQYEIPYPVPLAGSLISTGDGMIILSDVKKFVLSVINSKNIFGKDLWKIAEATPQALEPQGILLAV